MINREGLCYIILSPPPTYWKELHKQVLWDSDFSRENFSIQRSTFPRCPSRVIVPHTLKSLNQFIYIFFSFDFEQNFKMFFCSWALNFIPSNYFIYSSCVSKKFEMAFCSWGANFIPMRIQSEYEQIFKTRPSKQCGFCNYLLD